MLLITQFCEIKRYSFIPMYLKRIVCVGLYVPVSFKVDACETKRNKQTKNWTEKSYLAYQLFTKCVKSCELNREAQWTCLSIGGHEPGFGLVYGFGSISCEFLPNQEPFDFKMKNILEANYAWLMAKTIMCQK